MNRRSMFRVALLASMVAATALPGCAAEEGQGEGDEEVGQTRDALTDAARQRRAKAMFAAPIIARMYMPHAKKTIANKSAADVAKVLKARKPSIVSGLIRLDDDANLDAQEAAFADFRAVREGMKGVAFDIVLNACQYKTAGALTKHMGNINEKLGGMKPEAWFFDFYDTPLHDRKGDCDARGPGAKQALKEVAQWAHRNDQLIGGNVWSAGELPEGADFIGVPDEHGKKSTLELAARLPKDVAVLVHVENNPQNCWVKGGDASFLDDPRRPTKETCKGSGGDEYIWRMSPNERQKYDEDFVSEGRKAGFTYMRPVFFPLSNHLGGGDGAPQAFDRSANAAPGQLRYVAGP